MNAPLIKVGMPVSYDYAFLYHSLPLVYDHADRITLAVDQACRTWTGTPFAIADSFWDWIRDIDVQQKIDVYRDEFYRPGFKAMENDTRERMLLARQMGEGGWHVQIDSDEYFPNFGAFAQFLRRHSRWTHFGARPIDVCAFLIPLFKQVDGGFLYIKDAYETFFLATNFPDYKMARGSDHLIRYAPFCLFHQTWARAEPEVWTKANSIGHVDHFNVQSYFDLWKVVDRHNYRYIRNFHPLIPSVWPSLEWGPGKDISEFIRNFRQNHSIQVPTSLYFRRRLGQFRRSLLRRRFPAV